MDAQLNDESFKVGDPIVLRTGMAEVYVKLIQKDGGIYTFITPGGSLMEMGFLWAAIHAHKILPGTVDERTLEDFERRAKETHGACYEDLLDQFTWYRFTPGTK